MTGSECIPPPDGHVACVFGNGAQICQHTTLATEGQPCVGDSLSDGALPTGVSLDFAPTAEGAYCNRASGVVCKAGTCAKAIAAGEQCARDEDLRDTPS